MDKRSFIKSFSLLGLGSITPAFSLDRWIEKHEGIDPLQLSGDERFWSGIRRGYRLKSAYINLENGYYCIQPQETLEHFISHVREVNYQGAYYMRTVQAENKQRAVARLAELVQCPADELIITRNTTESLDMIIGGLDWKPGDEAVMAEQDYGSMLNMFRQVSQRHGTVNKIISLPNHPVSDDEIVNLYASAITSRTRLLMVCHIVNITGQILPVRKIADMAHARGVLVMVDGAHAVAHIQFKMADLNCDFYGASLHKWLSVPLGAGILHVKKEHIGKIWPLLSAGERKLDDIGRLNQTGTHPVHTDLAISNAIDYYYKIGPARKEDRLRYLQTYWTSKVRSLPGVNVNTPKDSTRHCAIANVGVTGIKPGDLADILLKKYKIYTVAIDGAGVHGCRITPNIYTTPAELDVLVQALKELSKNA
jgi:selenocysteine lyase/cysteine desulfurase